MNNTNQRSRRKRPTSTADEGSPARGHRPDSTIRPDDVFDPASVQPELQHWHSWSSHPETCQEVEKWMERTPLKGHIGDSKLLRTSMAIVMGLGAVGGPAFEQLARSGIGEIVGVDPDSYSEESFLTQPIPWSQRAGPKAPVQAARAHKANPSGVVHSVIGHAQDLPLRVLRRAAVLVCAGDNLELPLWACRVGAALGLPVVQAAVHGETASAFVRGYGLVDALAACARCGLGPGEVSAQRSRYGCDPGTLRKAGNEPTRTLPTICGLAAQFAANEALKWVTGNGQHALNGEEYAISLWTYRSWRTELPRNPDCELPHCRWELQDLADHWDAVTPSTIAKQLGATCDSGTLQVRSEIPWISYTFCPECCLRHAVRRFARIGSVVGRCKCGQTLRAGPQGAHSVIPLDDLRACWDHSFAELGLQPSEAVGMMPEEQWVYFFPPEADIPAHSPNTPHTWGSKQEEPS